MLTGIATGRFTFYNIYIKTHFVPFVLFVLILFTFYNIYIKTLHILLIFQVRMWYLHSTIFILKHNLVMQVALYQEKIYILQYLY